MSWPLLVLQEHSPIFSWLCWSSFLKPLPYVGHEVNWTTRCSLALPNICWQFMLMFDSMSNSLKAPTIGAYIFGWSPDEEALEYVYETRGNYWFDYFNVNTPTAHRLFHMQKLSRAQKHPDQCWWKGVQGSQPSSVFDYEALPKVVNGSAHAPLATNYPKSCYADRSFSEEVPLVPGLFKVVSLWCLPGIIIGWFSSDPISAVVMRLPIPSRPCPSMKRLMSLMGLSFRGSWLSFICKSSLA